MSSEGQRTTIEVDASNWTSLPRAPPAAFSSGHRAAHRGEQRRRPARDWAAFFAVQESILKQQRGAKTRIHSRWVSCCGSFQRPMRLGPKAWADRLQFPGPYQFPSHPATDQFHGHLKKGIKIVISSSRKQHHSTNQSIDASTINTTKTQCL